MKNILGALLVALFFGVCFTVAGIADNTVNEDWNRIHNPAVPVTIETHYIINGNDYVVAVEDVMTTIHWDGDKPVLNNK